MFTLVLLTGLSVLSLNMFLPSLSNMAETFQTDYTTVSLSIAGYLAMTAVLQLIIGPMSDLYGRRPLLLSGLAIFIFASVGCVLATDFWVFLAFRMLQATVICGAALSPAIIRDMVPERQAASLMGYVSMAMAIAPMLGPMAGGVLDELFGWRASFVTFAVFGIVVFALCWVDLGETNKTPSATFAKQFQTYPELLASRRFWGYSLCLAFSVSAFFAFVAGIPFVTKILFDMSTATLGFYMGTITIGFFLGSFLSGRYTERYGIITLMIAGRIIGCAGLVVGLAMVFSGYVQVISIFGATIMVGLGNGLTSPGCRAGAMSVRPQLSGSASGLSGALTVACGAVLTYITGAVLSENNAAYALLAIMLVTSTLALVAALYVVWVDHIEAACPGE